MHDLGTYEVFASQKELLFKTIHLRGQGWVLELSLTLGASKSLLVKQISQLGHCRVSILTDLVNNVRNDLL